MLYLCELVNNGIIQERFYREGKNAEAVKEGLELFKWGPGEWRIAPAEDPAEDDE